MSNEEKPTESPTPSDQQAVIDKLKSEVTKFNDRAKDLEKLIAQREKEDVLNEVFHLEEWQPVQTQYVATYLDKCVVRMNLHEDSARYYNKRHYCVILPATILGAVSSTTAFTQWSTNILNGETNVMWIVVGVITALTTLLHNLSEFVFAFKDKARQHQQSFINFSRLVKRIDNEYNNPVHEHKPYRQFIESISEDYDRYTEHAIMVPDAVNNLQRARWLKKFEAEKESVAYQQTNNIVATNDNPNIENVEKKRKKKRKITQARRESINPDVIIFKNNGFGSALDVRNVSSDQNHTPSPRTTEPNYTPSQRLSVLTTTDNPSDDLIDRFRLRNQMLRQNREARRMTINQFPETLTRSTLIAPVTQNSGRRLSDFEKKQQDMYRANTNMADTDFENLPFNSIIELNSMTSSDHSSKSNKQTQRDITNDNDAIERVSNKNQRRRLRKTGMPELRTGIATDTQTNVEHSNNGANTPDELNSIHSGVVHFQH